MPFDPKNLSGLLDSYEGVQAQQTTYAMGFTLIPPNMMEGGLNHVMPVDAIDGANMRDPAAGTMILRATKDANDNVHVISCSAMLGSESDSCSTRQCPLSIDCWERRMHSMCPAESL